MLELIDKKSFGNGNVFLFKNEVGQIFETTDTYLPLYTKNAKNNHNNFLISKDYGSRKERWLIGISVSSGCSVGCKFCASGNHFNGLLSTESMSEQLNYVIKHNNLDPKKSQNFKILMTRMGEPAYNRKSVFEFINKILLLYPKVEILISTVGIRNDFIIELLCRYPNINNIHLQFSIHTTDEEQRKNLIPNANLLTFFEIKQIGEDWIKTHERKITLNFTLLEGYKFCINKLKKYFPKELFFIKLSPLNENYFTNMNELKGVIK